MIVVPLHSTLVFPVSRAAVRLGLLPTDRIGHRSNRCSAANDLRIMAPAKHIDGRVLPSFPCLTGSRIVDLRLGRWPQTYCYTPYSPPEPSYVLLWQEDSNPLRGVHPPLAKSLPGRRGWLPAHTRDCASGIVGWQKKSAQPCPQTPLLGIRRGLGLRPEPNRGVQAPLQLERVSGEMPGRRAAVFRAGIHPSPGRSSR